MLNSSLRRVLVLPVLLLLAPALPATAHAQALRCGVLNDLFEYYLQGHVLQKQINEEIRVRTVERFVKNLDPSKTVLLAEDAERLKSTIRAAFPKVLEGDCSSIEEGHRTFLKRARESLEYSRSALGPKFKLDEKIEFVSDADKRVFAKSAADKNEYLLKLLHFQMASYKLGKLADAQAKKQLVHRYELLVKRTEEKIEKDPLTDFVEAFAESLDPHSSYMSQDSLEDFQIHMRLSLEGIGCSLASEDGFVVVEEIIPGGAADRAKLVHAKDKIIGVAAKAGDKFVNTIDMDLRDVVAMIRGRKNTQVGLQILREGAKPQTLEVVITRDKIDIKEAAAKIEYQERGKLKVGVITVPSFYGGNGERSTTDDVRKLLEAAKKGKAEAIVLDLTRNGGGLLEEAVSLSGLFIRKGNVVATQSGTRKPDVLDDSDPEVVWAGPLVVLISRASASASEIFAGAMRDYRRAVVVGDVHTFGKGTVQALQPLPGKMGAMKVTVGMFFVPGGKSTQKLGVDSDIRIPSLLDVAEIGEEKLDYSLPPQAIPAFLSKDTNYAEGPKKWAELGPDLITALREKSRARVAKDPKFAEISKRLAETQAKRGVIKIAEILKPEEGAVGKKGGKGAKTKQVAPASRADRKKLADEEKAKYEQPIIDESVTIAVDLALAVDAGGKLAAAAASSPR